MSRKWFIYCLTNTRNGKRYIGQTASSVQRRWWAHQHTAKLGGGFVVHAAIRKHGYDAFVVETIDAVTSQHAANQAERVWIAHRRSTEREYGYNVANGGADNVMLGRHHTLETRQQISAVNTGRKHTDIAKQRIATALTGRECKPETRAKIGAANRGKKRTAEQIEANAACQRGRKQSPELIERRIAPIRGIKRSAETRRRLSEAMRGKSRPNLAGDKNPQAKLTSHDVAVIKRRLLSGDTMASVARDYGMSYRAIVNIRDGISWVTVEPTSI